MTPDEAPFRGGMETFDRWSPRSGGSFTFIGSGQIGGKARGLAFINDSLVSALPEGASSGIQVTIPTSTVVTTDVFDAFMERNRLREVVTRDLRDDEIAHAFQRADLPAEIVGDLRAVSLKAREPLAIRSSSLFEDALHRPFAGVYATKMVPNNQPGADARFRVLAEAVKFVYASTFFREARAYIRTTGQSCLDEKMALLIQEVVGLRHGDRFYPHVSGVGRSYNYYRSGHARPEDGIVSLALGLGKTIVDGGLSWNYSPAYPRANPPYRSVGDMLKQTQTEFWAVNMGRPPAHDPIRETEYLVKGTLAEAEYDGALRFLVSTYEAANDRLLPGVRESGPRVLTFAPILAANDIPLNDVVRRLLAACREKVGTDVEMEFALTLDAREGVPARLSLLQVRPMLVLAGGVEVTENDLRAADVLASSDNVLGNGVVDSIRDVVYLRQDTFTEREAWVIASELEVLNERLVQAERPYVLIVYGRLGTTDAAYGIPVNWSQISAARTIVEVSRPDLTLESSQGSHFFHNVIGSQVGYFGVSDAGAYPVDWDWLNERPAERDTPFVRHVRLDTPLTVRIDGKSGRGVIRK